MNNQDELGRLCDYILICCFF